MMFEAGDIHKQVSWENLTREGSAPMWVIREWDQREREVPQVTHNGVQERPFVWEEVETAKDIWFYNIYWGINDSVDILLAV